MAAEGVETKSSKRRDGAERPIAGRSYSNDQNDKDRKAIEDKREGRSYAACRLE